MMVVAATVVSLKRFLLGGDCYDGVGVGVRETPETLCLFVFLCFLVFVPEITEITEIIRPD